MNPVRVQLSRRKGWRMPTNTVSVARPGKWGNPFKVTENKTAEEAVEMFRDWLTGPTASGRVIAALAPVELRGKNLACWCKIGAPCHAEILLEIANK